MKSIALFTLITLLSSCKITLTLNQKNIDAYHLTYDDLTQIQFYNSTDIVLTRYDNSTTNKSTEKGNLTVSLGRQIDQVIIRINTPGKVVKQLDNHRLAVSFEEDESKYLVFGLSREGVYHLQAIEWQGSRGRVKYGNGDYFTQEKADTCALKFKLKKGYNETKQVRIVKGNKIK
ncbi:MAG: hypothetical protein R2813_03625 [Flavobacteriales bacterium]